MNYNLEYFNSLLNKFNDPKVVDFQINQPEAGIKSNIIPFALADKKDLEQVDIKQYKDLTISRDALKKTNLVLVKMHAGLGSSVKRADLLKKWDNRDTLGSKGTDLYLELDGEYKSLAELQLKQVECLTNKKIYKSVSLQNLVNYETSKQVDSLSENFKNSVNVLASIDQQKMQTIAEDGCVTSARLAPAGHAFLGFYQLFDLFLNKNEVDEVMVIGNGEDLNSTADEQMISWVVEQEIPIVMITTTKLAKDKKGGQISLVKNDKRDYVTIIEKAQAEKSNQLSYFEQIGLRDTDNKSLFNTNIVILNKKVLKNKFNEFLKDTTAEEFKTVISPDLIKNVKEQDGKSFTQLEGAIGSTLLNLDQFFRVEFNCPLISFLNLDPQDREKFFIPIKKIEDFNELLNKYDYSAESGRFELKDL
jgi:hypothetical protein